ncbi:MAG: tRNA (adenosine(37)-N6)-threonylcarbamoyltransferase complex transferase subunit TsaD [Candidatus Improbicoccus devescovinae]|nr:MAG: tRNA (adenosine(37)-N6)-threonylcarbamoyltransferase complex transferase subunit TsaD [Candidatus Improbicoccus devescovinae]
MYILAIESSCDDTSGAIVENGSKVISCVTESQRRLHNQFGGVVPEVAARGHLDSIFRVMRKTLEHANININKIDAVAVTFTPGLIGPLLVGVNFAKGFALARGIPVIGVNHIKAHVAANYIENSELTPPFLCLVVSGGHTSLIKIINYTEFILIGQTRDDAVGEVFDKIARNLGLGYPGGAALDKLAEIGNNQKFKFTIPRLDNLDFSFSGMKTKAMQYMQNAQNFDSEAFKNDLAASVRETIVKYLTQNLILAAGILNIKKISVAGGVASNSYLKKKIYEMCIKKGLEFYAPSPKYCTDNAAMIGIQGYFEYINGNISDLKLNAYASGSPESKI